MDKQTKDMLNKYGFRFKKVGGDPLRDVYEDLGARPEYVFCDMREFARDMEPYIDGKDNPTYLKAIPNPGYGQEITPREAILILISYGRIDENWLTGLE